MWHNSRVGLRIEPSAPLLLAVFVLLSSPLLLFALLLAALLHEVGHYVALRRLRGRVTAIHITALGAEMQVAGRLSYGGELLAAAAGPAVNLLLALFLGLCGRLWDVLYLFAGAQLILGLFNLLPVRPLDGGSILWNLTAWLTEPYTADRVAAAAGTAVSVLLAMAAVAALWLGGSPFMLLAALGLLWHALRQIRGCQTAGKKVKYYNI